MWYIPHWRPTWDGRRLTMSRMPSPSERQREHTETVSALFHKVYSISPLHQAGTNLQFYDWTLITDFSCISRIHNIFPRLLVVLGDFCEQTRNRDRFRVPVEIRSDRKKFLTVSRKEWVHFREENPHDLTTNMEFNHLDTQPGINQFTPSEPRKSAFP